MNNKTEFFTELPAPNPDCLLPTDNLLEIPVLRLDRQPDIVSVPVLCYGEQQRAKDMQGQGILHFYTDDYRFRSIYDHPEKILPQNPGAIVEPNFSLFNNTPLAFGLQSIYKKRWISRIMQDQGIPVFVDLNVANKWSILNLIGVPEGYTAFCTRGDSDHIPSLDYEYELACQKAGGTPRFFLVYGGGKKVRDWCRSHPETQYLTPLITERNRRIALERMSDIAVNPEEITNLLEASSASI